MLLSPGIPVFPGSLSGQQDTYPYASLEVDLPSIVAKKSICSVASLVKLVVATGRAMLQAIIGFILLSGLMDCSTMHEMYLNFLYRK